jgi:hypothetical protein
LDSLDFRPLSVLAGPSLASPPPPGPPFAFRRSGVAAWRQTGRGPGGPAAMPSGRADLHDHEGRSWQGGQEAGRA